MADQEPCQLWCACCGGDAGKWLQWHNQDSGFGMCRVCADRIIDPSRSVPMTQKEFRHCYGVAGVNYQAHTIVRHGQEWPVLATFNADAVGQQEAHEYEEQYPDAVAFGVEQGMLIYVRKDIADPL